MMMSDVRANAAFPIGLACALLFLFVAISSAGKPAVNALTFSIDNPPNTVFADSSDGYKDYRLSTEVPADSNYCVEASSDSSGFVFIRLNRKLDGDAGTQYCGLNGGAPRQFTLTVTGTACAELFDQGFASTADPTGCTVTGSDKPRIRLSNLYANRAGKTPVAFLIESYSNQISYELRTDADADIHILAGDTNVRQVQYAGTARLWKFHTGKVAPVAAPFSLPFQMTFHRTAL